VFVLAVEEVMVDDVVLLIVVEELFKLLFVVLLGFFISFKLGDAKFEVVVGADDEFVFV